MDDFLEFEKDNKSIKSIILDDFSVDELNSYISELQKEIDRVNIEVKKKIKLQEEAKKFFK